MNRRDLLQDIKERFVAKLESIGDEGKALKEEVIASAPLGPKEAIGETARDDFPILRRKEVLMQAVFRGSFGQAFTADAGTFRGSLEEVLELPMQSIFERAVYVSTMNAVLRGLGLVEKTVHCKNDGPMECAVHIGRWIKDQGMDKVGQVGLQPAILEALVKAIGPEGAMVSDLAEAGKIRYGVAVQDGMDSSKMFEDCQLILITGSTLVNGTIDDLLKKAIQHERRVVFYGTTIAGAAYLLGLERWCPCST